jgi:hypothetical protein
MMEAGRRNEHAVTACDHQQQEGRSPSGDEAPRWGDMGCGRSADMAMTYEKKASFSVKHHALRTDGHEAAWLAHLPILLPSDHILSPAGLVRSAAHCLVHPQVRRFGPSRAMRSGAMVASFSCPGCGQ